MLSGIKFLARDEIDKAGDEDPDAKRKKSGRGKEKGSSRKKKRSSGYSSSDDDLERISGRSRRSKKKWYSSEEYSSSSSRGSGSESESDEDEDGKKHRSRRKKKKKKKKKSRGGRKDYSSEDDSSSVSEGGSTKYERKKKSKGSKKGGDSLSDDGGGTPSLREKEIVRKEMGLEWMLRPAEKTEKRPAVAAESKPEDPPAEEVRQENHKELNPYLKSNGSGYPEEADEKRAGADQLLSSSLVGDGGASWRLKALKRAKEQSAREGRRLDEVVEERWGSLGQLAVSAASHRAAPSRAHLHAIRNRKQGQVEEHQSDTPHQMERDAEKKPDRHHSRYATSRHFEMRAPKVHDSLSWGKRRGQKMSAEDAELISAAVSGINKFANDGSFMQEFLKKKSDDLKESDSRMSTNRDTDSEMIRSDTNESSEPATMISEPLSANQLAAKALQLRMNGKHEEAEKLLKEAENMKTQLGAGHKSRQKNVESTSRYTLQDISLKKSKDDDADMHLARKIMQNKQYSMSGQADDEYDFEDGPSRKSWKKGRMNDQKVSGKDKIVQRILTQQERCLYCFENPNRPKHLVVAIANFTYLMLPQWQPVAPGHCCILPMQHESATRNVDNNVWDEIRNFKKCLIMMFAQQEKELVFLETVMNLAQQRRHCMIECIPLPLEIAKQAPLYFKKAIDEAEDEWSQHNAKKLIDTSVKGLRGSIPKNFPYFHVEFGLDRGFVHVIDDEGQFKSSLGLNVIRGMLRLPAEDIHRHRRHESMESQKQAVATFTRDWEPFDWTKQLD